MPDGQSSGQKFPGVVDIQPQDKGPLACFDFKLVLASQA
jgi:hypothetical protein